MPIPIVRLGPSLMLLGHFTGHQMLCNQGPPLRAMRPFAGDEACTASSLAACTASRPVVQGRKVTFSLRNCELCKSSFPKVCDVYARCTI